MVQPLRGRLISCCRFATMVAMLIVGVGADAETTNGLSDAEVQGRALAQEILGQRPDQNFTSTGELQIRDADGTFKKIPLSFETMVTATNWYSEDKAIYTNHVEMVRVIHTVGQPNVYFYSSYPLLQSVPVLGHLFRSPKSLSNVEIMAPFANSDFWICDLGLEFFHWPDQKIIKKEFMRGCGCMVLESTNPDPGTNGYSRVDSWIDEQSHGIVQAEAYDTNGKLLKKFDPKTVEKVNGQWELHEMEMLNVQTRSRTRIEFDLKAD